MASPAHGTAVSEMASVTGTLESGATWKITCGKGGMQLKVPASGRAAKLHRLHGDAPACISRAAGILNTTSENVPNELRSYILRACELNLSNTVTAPRQSSCRDTFLLNVHRLVCSSVCAGGMALLADDAELPATPDDGLALTDANRTGVRRRRSNSFILGRFHKQCHLCVDVFPCTQESCMKQAKRKARL